ncbi:MAG TPA: outer membrane protein assembly factor BamD [Labilithrix sp.]
MSEPRRLLLDPETSGFERELLGAWGAEQPSETARDRVMGLATIAAGAAVGAAALGAKAGGSIAPKAAATSIAAILKWLAIGVVVAGGAASGVAYVTRDRSIPTATATATATPIASATPTASATATATTSATDDTPAVTPSSLPAARATRADTLADQIAMMDAIRSAIASGNGGRALRLVDDYERRFPRGAFVEEAEALRVEAIAKTGDSAAAQRAADRFLAAHPGSPHAARIRALVKSSAP